MSTTAGRLETHEARVSERLTSLLETLKNLVAWLATVDHKKLGKRYIVTSFVFFFIRGVEAALLRVQLVRPENHFLSPEAFKSAVHDAWNNHSFSVPAAGAFRLQLLSRTAAHRGMLYVFSL